MAYLWSWVLLALLVMVIGAWPTWPYSRERWGYGPSTLAVVAILLIFALVWLGWLAIWWPWTFTG